MANGISLAAVFLATALALNIGANNSAAEMGPAYGAGIRSRREAVVLIAIFCFAGATLAGHRVMATLGHGLIRSDALATNPLAAVIVVVAMLVLLVVANVLRVPVSTSQVAVGAVIGAGLFHQAADIGLFATVAGWWVATPVAAFGISYVVGRHCYPRLVLLVGSLRSEQAVNRVMRAIVTVSGCWIAFSAGSNNLANSVGPVVGAGFLGATTAVLLGGGGMALGALLLGGRLMKTVGKEITALCPICATLVEAISASIVLTASLFGMPVSLAEIVTCSVIGFACAANGFRGTAGNYHIRRMAVLWPVAPLAAATLTFGGLVCVTTWSPI